jgi:hypothetical protein
VAETYSDELAAAAMDRSRVQGATHQFYRYPARFSPLFVRAAIERFTKPGDLIFDPFVGGGTTAVEAMRLGRDAVGFDINELALFISGVKTTPLSDGDRDRLLTWADEIPSIINLKHSVELDEDREAAGYLRNLAAYGAWRHRKAIQQVLDSILLLPRPRLREFARCALLRTAQSALDGTRTPGSIGAFRKKLQANAVDMLDDMGRLEAELAALNRNASIALVKRPAQEADREEIFADRAPQLVLTSPPYPGVHVLYHRWQIGGRRETAAPYWIANKLDGDGERYYTLGHRHEKGLATYYDNLKASFAAVAKVSGEHTTIVQMVAFSQPEWQLPRYLETMEACGFVELLDGERSWRDVPNRKWYAQFQPNQSSSREVVLIHKKA